MANMQNFLNTIRANASAEYQNRVPLAERTNLDAIGSPILTYQSTQNEFLTALVNRIGLSVIQNKMAHNPLALLKKGTQPLGSDIQEIFTNLATDKGYDATGSKLMTVTKPDVKALYHRVNRQGQYPVTIYKNQLKRAFVSYSELEKFFSSIITSLYSGDLQDEFILMKNLFADAVKNSKVVTVSVSHVDDEASGKEFIKAVKNASSGFRFFSSAFNTYYDNRPVGDTGNPVQTMTPIEDQILVVRADIMNSIDVDVLAKAFNLSNVDFLAKVVQVDSFGSASNCLAVLIDRSWVQVYDELFETSDFYNSQGLYWNYWLNHWQTYSFSYFANACAFVCDDETLSLNKTTLSFTTTATQTITATKTPSDAVVAWLTTDATIATVVDGVVTPHANGTCVINAINGDKIASVAVTVNIA